MATSMRFQGKTMLVVGGSAQVARTEPSPSAYEGWAAAIAKRLASDGAEVLILDSEDWWVSALSAQIGAAGGNASGFTADIADFEAMTALARQWLASGRKLDALVTCYLDIAWDSIENCDIAVFERVTLFNLVGPLKAVKAFLPLLKRGKDASIVHLGSVDGLFGAALVPSYSAAKGGLVALTHIMAYEFARYDIRVNTIASCGTVEMPHLDQAKETPLGIKGFPGADYMRRLNAATPLKRYSLTEWAGAAAFLVSEDAAHVTGSVMVVDCGRTILTPGTQTTY